MLHTLWIYARDRNVLKQHVFSGVDDLCLHCDADLQDPGPCPNAPAWATDFECNHDEVSWNPLEFTYSIDGTALVWQLGGCKTCGQRMKLTYEAAEPHITP